MLALGEEADSYANAPTTDMPVAPRRTRAKAMSFCLSERAASASGERKSA